MATSGARPGERPGEGPGEGGAGARREVGAVGAYRLEAPLGQGGMGAVFSARLAGSSAPVAIKLLPRASVADRWSRLRFQEEVRAVARLSHENIVEVYDQGELDHELRLPGAAAAAAVEGGFGPGSLWLAMERVRGASLSPARGRARWPYVRAVLVGMLRGLAHSHARGLLHRDIKPANVLVENDYHHDDPGRVVLVDFGLARAVAEAPDPEDRAVVVGTAGYMAPEQLSGLDEQFGPWTDLFAVGCLAWSLCSGAPPWGGGHGFTSLLRELREQPMPAFFARHPVPPGLEAWLSWLLQPDPRDRPRRAADALRALLAIDAGPLAGPALRLAGRPGPPPAEPPLITPAPRAAGGAGLGLFRLRQPPLMGREAEQRALWAAAVAGLAGAPALCLVEGAPGAGKSALLRWLAEQLSEQGLADIYTVQHADPPGPDAGLAAAVRRWLGLWGPLDADPHGVLGRVDAQAQRLGLEPRALRRLAGLGGAADAGFDRVGALLGLLRALSGDRPAVLLLEDLQWGADAAGVLAQVLERQGGGPPVLAAATARAGAELGPLARWAAAPGAAHLRLAPLLPGHQRQLAAQLLPLPDADLDTLALRAQGSPLLLLQLLEIWVDAGQLRAEGPRLQRAGDERSLPADLAATWRARLSPALRRAGDGARDLIEIAAVLGFQVDGDEWVAAAGPGGGARCAALLDHLAAAGLALPEAAGAPGSFRFAHALLREAVLAEAEAAGRLDRARAACVDALLPRPAACLRAGRLLLALGQPDRAVGPLDEGAWRAVLDSDFLLAADALRARARALAGAQAAPADPRWVQGWLTEARVARRRGAWDEARAAADRAAVGARQHQHRALLVQALREQSRIAQVEDRPHQALLYAKDALQHALRVGEPDSLAWCRRDLGLLEVAAGHRGAAVDTSLAAAQVHFQSTDEPFGAASCLLARAQHNQREGNRAQAEAQLRLARGLYARAAERQEPASAWAGLGEVARLSGRPAEAARWLDAARQRLSAIGHPGLPRLQLHLADVELQRGRARAARLALPAGPGVGEDGLWWAILGWLALAEGEGAGCAARWTQGPARPEALLDPEVAELAERCARAASAAGAAEACAAAWAAAGRAWTGLGWGRRARVAEARAAAVVGALSPEAESTRR
jgi:hypothetical protein